MPLANNKLTSNNVPFNEEAEKAVISCMINHTEILDKAMDLLTDGYFYSRRCKLIFRCIKELYIERENIDLLTVKDRVLKRTEEELKDANIIDKSQINVKFFSDITTIPTITEYIESYCEEVKRLYVRRQIKYYCEQLALDSIKNEKKVNDILLEAQRVFFDLSKQKDDKDFEYLHQLLPEVLDKMNEAANVKGGLIGVTSGFKVLDNYTQGFQKQDFIVIGARPSVGKTSLALNIAYNMAKANKKVAFFSLEMGARSLAQRLLSMEAVIPSEKVRSGHLSDSEWNKTIETVIELKEKADDYIFFNANSFLTIAELRSKCRKLKSENNLDCVIIDYLQLMHAGIENYNGKSDYSRLIKNRQEEVAEISRSLKGIAKEIDIPVIALAQLNRNTDSKKETQLSDIRESGAIEQDADLIIFIEKENENKDDSQAGNNNYLSDTIILNISKHRNGKTGKINLRFDKNTTKFYEYDNQFKDGKLN